MQHYYLYVLSCGPINCKTDKVVVNYIAFVSRDE